MEMPSLKALQQLYTAEVLSASRGEQKNTEEVIGLLRLPAGTDADSRLAVYRDGYPSRIAESLQDTYPALFNILGQGSFRNLVRRYLGATDVRHYRLAEVGLDLPAYCIDDALTKDLGFLPDLALLEWRLLEAFHAHLESPVAPQSITALSAEQWETVRFDFQKACSVVESAWPVHDLWSARETPRDAIDLDLEDRPQSCLVFRRGDEVACERIPAGEAQLTRSLVEGSTLSDAVEALADQEEMATRIGPLFARWQQNGLITGFRV